MDMGELWKSTGVMVVKQYYLRCSRLSEHVSRKLGQKKSTLNKGAFHQFNDYFSETPNALIDSTFKYLSTGRLLAFWNSFIALIV